MGELLKGFREGLISPTGLMLTTISNAVALGANIALHRGVWWVIFTLAMTALSAFFCLRAIGDNK